MPAAPAKKSTESWLQGGSKTEAARRHQNKTAKEHYFGKREVAKTDPKMEPPRGPIFVTVQSKTQPDKRSPRFIAHSRTRMPLAPLTLPRWPFLAVGQPFALICLTPLTSAKSAHAAIQLSRPLDCIQSISLAAHAPQTKMHCLQADERQATVLHRCKQRKCSPKTFHSCQPRLPKRVQKAGRKVAPKQRPPGGTKTRPPKNTILGKERLPKRTQKWNRRAVPFL